MTYRGASPDSAQKVVQSLLTIFVESSLGDSKADNESARRFIDEQIKTYEAKLTEAEARLKEFRLRNIDMQTQGGLDMAGRMAEISTHLSQARLELREAEGARDAAQRQIQQLRDRQRTIAEPVQRGRGHARDRCSHRCAQAQSGHACCSATPISILM